MFLLLTRLFLFLTASLFLAGSVFQMSYHKDIETGLFMCMTSVITCGFALGLEFVIKQQELENRSRQRISVDELYGRQDPEKRKIH